MVNKMSTSRESPQINPPLFDEEDSRLDAAIDVDTFNKTSVYNVPGYKPVHVELTHVAARVTGKLPEDLGGVYLRNGTNVQFERTFQRLHAFTGAGMIHQIQIKDGVATYSNFYIRTPRFEVERQAGREVFTSVSDIAGGGRAILEKMKRLQKKMQEGKVPALSSLELTTGSTSIRYHAGRIYCLNESGYAFVLSAAFKGGRLFFDGTGKLEDWSGEWDGPFSAHPRFDPDNGDMYNLSVDANGRILAGRITQGLRHSQSALHQFPSKGGIGWLHDFILTENYLIFPDISMRRDFSLLSEDKSIFYFDKDYPMRWGVLPRYFKEGDTVQWFTTKEANTIWHVINGWERAKEGGGKEIVLYAPAFQWYPPDLPIHTPEEPPARVLKWVLDLEAGKVTDEALLIDHGYERPSLNLAKVSKPSQFCYLLDEHGDGYMGKGVLKYDLLQEEEVSYLDYRDMYGGEALFVPKANAVREDDGYLLDLLMAEDRADLIVVDAGSMTELARIHLPQRVPFGVHAVWLAQDDLAAVKELND